MSTIALFPTQPQTRSRVHAPTRVRTTPGPVRLTRRGRLVVLGLALVLVVLAGVLLAGGSMATSEKGTPPPTEVITVGTGDTLWAIATERAQGDDVRDMIQHIQALNALDGGLVVTGQRLRVPTS